MNDTQLDWLNRLADEEATEQFRRCCGAAAWCRGMLLCRPFSDIDHVHRSADLVFDSLEEQDWKEAFASHPQIGDLTSLRMKFAGNKDWSAAEQSGIASAEDDTLTALANGNACYLSKFGFIFIVCAAGKSASEMLDHLQQRLPLEPSIEIQNAALEQRKITHLRIDKMNRNLS